MKDFIEATWHRGDGKQSKVKIIGWSVSGPSNIDTIGAQAGIIQLKPVAVVVAEGDKRLRYIDLKYLEVTL